MSAGATANLAGQQVCTFHALCHRLLSEHRSHTRLGAGFRLIDDFEQRYLVYRHLSAFNEAANIDRLYHGRKRDRWTQAGQLCRWVNKVSEEALDPAALVASTAPGLVTLGLVFERYQSILAQENVLDLPGLQTALLALLNDRPEIAKALQERFSHVMVDEYQDTNTIQEKILLKLVNHQGNLCVVGDDDQSLYRFRGATVRNLLEFPQLFPATPTTRIDLEINYRSHPRIIHFCRWWIADEDWEIGEQTFRLEKSLEPRNETFDDTPTVIKLVGDESSDNGNAWSEHCIGLLEKLRTEGALSDWNQVAFLFHSVRSKEAIELSTALEAHGIPVHSPRSKKFFARLEIQLVIGAFLFVFPHTHALHIRGMQYYGHTWEYYVRCRDRLLENLGKPEHTPCQEWLDERRTDLLRGKPDFSGGFCGFLYQLLRFPLFAHSLQKGTPSDTVLQERSTKNLALMSQMLSRFDEIHELTTFNGKTVGGPLGQLLNHYLRCLIDDGINEFENATLPAPSGYVSFLTIHQAKGLEFPVVICGSMDSYPWSQEHEIDKTLATTGLLHKPPFEPTNKVADYDFRRLFYTAFTRAQNLLVLSVRNTSRCQPLREGPFKQYLVDLPDWDSEQFEPDQLNLGSIKSVDPYPELSLVEDIHLYEHCPRKYQFFRVLGFAPIFEKPDAIGRLVRDTLEDVHRYRMSGTPDTAIKDEDVFGWLEHNRSKMSRVDQAALDANAMSDAHDLVNAYVRKLNDDNIAVEAVDLELKLDTQFYSVQTKADVTSSKEGELGIRVFRAQASAGERNILGQYQAQRQINMFSEVASKLLNQPVTKLTTINAMGGTDGDQSQFDFKVESSPDDSLTEVDRTVQKMMRNDLNVEQRPTKLCNRCEMQPCCDGKDCISINSF